MNIYYFSTIERNKKGGEPWLTTLYLDDSGID